MKPLNTLACFKIQFDDLLASLMFVFLAIVLVGCTNSTPRTDFYSASGQVAHTVACSAGEYEGCLQKIGDICGENGYIVLEKARQIKWGLWFDSSPEILLAAQCKTQP